MEKLTLVEEIKKNAGIEPIEEMAMKVYKSPEEAVADINDIYGKVMKGNILGDYRGPLESAMKYIAGIQNPERYIREIKKAKAAMKKVVEFKNSRRQGGIVNTTT